MLADKTYSFSIDNFCLQMLVTDAHRSKYLKENFRVLKNGGYAYFNAIHQANPPGETIDSKARRAFVLTLQAREQHIRREKAMSNICTNQGLCAVRALIYMALLGKGGLKKIANLCREKTEFAKDKLDAIKGVEVKRKSPTFNEFTIKVENKDPNEIIGKLIDKGIAAGFPLGRYYKEMKDYMLIAVTEKRTKGEITTFAQAMEDALWS